MDYMIELRSNIHQRDSLKFHVLVTKGCSIHAFFIKVHMTEDVAQSMISEKVAERVTIKWCVLVVFCLTQEKGGTKLCVLLRPT